MNTNRRTLVMSLAGALLLAGMVASPAVAKAKPVVTPSAVIYDATPQPAQPNVPSLGYQATSTAEFGDQVTFAGTQRRLLSATVTMSAWALHATYPTMDPDGWTHPITLNIYAVGGVNPGASIASVTQVMDIPWRPAADPTCAGGGTAWRAGDGNCYNGYAFDITFDLADDAITVPDSVVFGIAYDTNTWGYNPIGAPGPYESLNVGLNTSASAPTIGTNDDDDDVYWNTAQAGFYTDGGLAGVGTFRQDTDWTGYQVAAKFVAANPVPASKDDCKKDGWRMLADLEGNAFKNQGACVSYANNG